MRYYNLEMMNCSFLKPEGEEPYKIWLDDERMAPKGWVHIKTDDYAVWCMKNCKVSHISLDHDLGEDCGTGYDVICWIEEEVFMNNKFILPEISIHSANPVGVSKMKQVLEVIRRRNV